MENNFTSLALTAKLIKSIGWLVSLVLALASTAFIIYSADPYSEFATINYLYIAGLILISALIGVLINAIGQIIECFLSIERNTRKQAMQNEATEFTDFSKFEE